ncbi:MAG: aldolase/citrate lyase family protein [Sphingobium sp.]
MTERRKCFRERLSNDQALFGVMQAHPNSLITDLASVCGYDFLFLDGEHGLFGLGDYADALRALKASGEDILAMVRPPNHDPHLIGLYLDMGMDIIAVPNVTTRTEAEMLMRAMEYPPGGNRGVGAAMHRVTRYGTEAASYHSDSRNGAGLIVIIESQLGAANADEILSVDGVDGAIIGLADLSTDLGCYGDYRHPDYLSAFAEIERAATTNQKLLGTVPHGNNSIESLYDRGHRLFILASDVSLVREAMTTKLSMARDALINEQGTNVR